MIDPQGCASNHDVAMRSLIEMQVKELCQKRGLDFNLLAVEMVGTEVHIRMKDGSDVHKYLGIMSMKPAKDTYKKPVDSPKLNRKERRAMERGRR